MFHVMNLTEELGRHSSSFLLSLSKVALCTSRFDGKLYDIGYIRWIAEG